MQVPVLANACLAYAQNLQCFRGYNEDNVKKFICSNFDLIYFPNREAILVANLTPTTTFIVLS